MEGSTEQSNSNERAHHYMELVDGLNAMWNNKFDEADSFFSKQKDFNPRYALHYAETMAFKSVISELVKDREDAINRMNLTVKLAEEHIKLLESGQIPKKRTDITKQNAHNFLLDTKIVQADAYTLMASLQVMDEQRVKGMLNLRKGWKIYKETLATIKDSHDVDVISSLKFGAGLFYFLISLIPPGLPQKAASLAGFSGGNRELGLQYLRECYASNSIRSFWGGIVIALNHLFLSADLDPVASKPLIIEAEGILKRGVAQYPEGSLFQAVSGLTRLETNNVDEALTFAEVAIKNSKHVTEFPAIFYRLLSNCYIMKFEWQKTADCMQQGIDQIKKAKSKNPWAGTWNLLRLGACHIMLGNNDKAKKCFQETAAVKSSERWNEMLSHQANRYLANGGYFSMYELMLLTGHYDKVLNNCDDKKRDEILASIEEFAKKAPGALTKLVPKAPETGIKGIFSSPKFFKSNANNAQVDNRISYLVLKAIALKTANKLQEAADCLTEVINYDKQLDDKMYIALAQLEMGRVISRKTPLESIKHFDIVLKMDDFDWETIIKSRARTFKRDIAKEDKEETTVTEENDKDVEQLLEDSEDLRQLMKAEENEVDS